MDIIKTIQSISFYFNKKLTHTWTFHRWQKKRKSYFCNFLHMKLKINAPFTLYKMSEMIRSSDQNSNAVNRKLSCQFTLYFAHGLLIGWPFIVQKNLKKIVRLILLRYYLKPWTCINHSIKFRSFIPQLNLQLCSLFFKNSDTV